MSLLSALSTHDGIMRTAQLVELGYSRHRIAVALSTGTIMRPMRGWVALPTTDRALVLAARGAGILSCVTQAKRLGLWNVSPPQLHLAARSRGSRIDGETHIAHWARPVIPRAPYTLQDCVENTLGYVASCRPFEEAHAIWESALNKKLVHLHSLRQLPYTGAAKELLSVCTPFSDSGLESIAAVRLRWLPVSVIPQAWVLGHRVDALIGRRLVLQIDGGTHVGRQRISDNRHDAELQLLGYTVIRVGYVQVMEHWPEVQDRIMRAIAQGLHLAR